MIFNLQQLRFFPVCFGHRFGFAYHIKAQSTSSFLAFCPSRRFSSSLGQMRWRANLLQNTRHHTSHLPWGDCTLPVFPGMQHRQAALLAQQQLITGTCHNPAPSFHLLWCVHVSPQPEQVLFQKAIPVLLRKTLPVPCIHVFQRDHLISCPDKPAFSWITFRCACRFPLHLDHADFSVWCLTKMQVLPTRNNQTSTLLISAFPPVIGSPVRLGSLAWGSTLVALVRWCRSIQPTIRLTL